MGDLSTSKILRSQPFGFDFDPDACVNVICKMAKHLQYYDPTFRSEKPLKVKYNNKYHPANLLSALEVPWQQIEIQGIDDAGPCVAIHWPDDNSFAMVPIKCIKPERKDL